MSKYNGTASSNQLTIFIRRDGHRVVDGDAGQWAVEVAALVLPAVLVGLLCLQASCTWTDRWGWLRWGHYMEQWYMETHGLTEMGHYMEQWYMETHGLTEMGPLHRTMVHGDTWGWQRWGHYMEQWCMETHGVDRDGAITWNNGTRRHIGLTEIGPLHATMVHRDTWGWLRWGHYMEQWYMETHGVDWDRAITWNNGT